MPSAAIRVYGLPGGDSCTSDEDRVELLLKNMKDVPWEERGARFRCVIAIAQPKSPLTPIYERGEQASPFRKGGREGDFRTSEADQVLLVTRSEGFVAGMIQLEAAGENGFGYDPVFYLPEYDQTAAQISSDVKNQISHRAKAAGKAVEALKKLTTDSR